MARTLHQKEVSSLAVLLLDQRSAVLWNTDKDSLYSAKVFPARLSQKKRCIGIYFGFSMGIAPTLSYAYGEKNLAVCRKLEGYAYRFLLLAPPVIYGLLYLLTPIGVSCFAADTDAVYSMAVEGMRVYGMGFLVSGINIFAAICMMSYGKGGYSGSITFMRSFLLLLVFLYVLPERIGIYGLWMSMPAAELLTMVVSVIILTAKKDRTNEKSEYSFYHK